MLPMNLSDYLDVFRPKCMSYKLIIRNDPIDKLKAKLDSAEEVIQRHAQRIEYINSFLKLWERYSRLVSSSWCQGEGRNDTYLLYGVNLLVVQAIVNDDQLQDEMQLFQTYFDKLLFDN